MRLDNKLIYMYVNYCYSTDTYRLLTYRWCHFLQVIITLVSVIKKNTDYIADNIDNIGLCVCNEIYLIMIKGSRRNDQC